MKCLCTYFDSFFMTKGMALYESLIEHADDFCLFVLCLDDTVYRMCQSKDDSRLRPILLNELEECYSELLNVKGTRKKIEYYFTVTPFLPLFILKNYPDFKSVIYVDADMYFFSSLEAIYDELGSASIMINPHDFSPAKKKLEVNGIFNVGLVFFKNDSNGLACLNWWAKRCLEWCYDKPDGDRFADQKYLDKWPQLFEDVKVCSNRGISAGPWNMHSGLVSEENGKVMVGDESLVVFHFHGLQKITEKIYDPNFAVFGTDLSKVIASKVFIPYIKKLLELEKEFAESLHTRKDVEKPVREKRRGFFKQIYIWCSIVVKLFLGYIVIVKE